MLPSVSRLTCEYGSANLGLDTSRPRFSWWIDDARPGAVQTAYRLQVATDPAFPDDALIWDSGELPSADSVLVEYAGAPLASRTRYHYRVRVRDQGEQWSAWSEPAWFETAFLDPAEWQADWISPSDEPSPAADEAPRAAPYLRREFSVDGEVISARLYASARGLFELSLNGRPVTDDVFVPGWTDYDFRSQYVTYDVSELVVSGANAIGAILGDGWYSGRIARIRDGERRFGARPQLLCELHVSTADGERVIRSDDEWSWKAGPIASSDIYDGEAYDARAELPGWDTPGADVSDWEPVRVVGPALASWDGGDPPAADPARRSSGGESFPGIEAASDDAQARRMRLDAKVVPPVRRVRELTP
ncbi:MAG: alpha-L-rhamnosidase N-terminal domain-containing protein, partial [Spirochaetota bacterium]